MRVWVDQKQCVGNGVCAELAPDVFVLGTNDVAFTCEDGRVLRPDESARVPPHLESAVLDAVDECPAACIYLDD
jgi:ferredoxin